MPQQKHPDISAVGLAGPQQDISGDPGELAWKTVRAVHCHALTGEL